MLNSLIGPAKGALRRSPFARTIVRPAFLVRNAALTRRQQGLVRRELENSPVLERLASGEPLPPGYGIGANARVVQIPWLLAQRPAGKMLDAGSAQNHVDYLDRLQPLVSELHIVTLADEGVAHPERGISYAFADLRRLPYLDRYFDMVASISTLEHVGMDNTDYGASSPRASGERGRARRPGACADADARRAASSQRSVRTTGTPRALPPSSTVKTWKAWSKLRRPRTPRFRSTATPRPAGP